jgi:hypothetical protein
MPVDDSFSEDLDDVPGHGTLPPMSKSTVGSCPTEIWAAICALACTDDGTTGRALSLVSKYMNEASKPFKYQCISVKERQLRPLVAAVEKLPPAARRFRNLFVSASERHQGEYFHADKRRLLLLVAPTLVTLQVVSHLDDFIVLPFSLPALLDLTIDCGRYSNTMRDLLATLESHPVCYPSLQRLHLAGFLPQLGDDAGITDAIVRMAPGLTHLRLSLSGFNMTSKFAYSNILYGLGHPQLRPSPTTSTMLPHAVRFIFLQQRLRYAGMSSNILKTMVSEVKADKRVVLLRDVANPSFDESQALWAEWCAGGRDWWDPAEEEVDSGRIM